MLSFSVHGKWILAGEHAVLRGSPALVFPISSRFLEVQFENTNDDFSVAFEPENNDLHIGFWSVFEKALQMVNKSRKDFSGQLLLRNNIPIGAGMGASATLCVAVARLFEHFQFVKSDEIYEFSKSLEDLFHGKSSGVDVAVALLNQPLAFKVPAEIEKFAPKWRPHFYLSFCGKRAITADCVSKVQKLFAENPELAQALDQQMQDAVIEARKALESNQGLAQLQSAVEQAGQCFEKWGLVSDHLRNHMEELRRLGALAVKPTGSGEGGYVLSLWDKSLDSEQMSFELIPC